MNRLGVNTFVLCGEFPDSVSPWDEDIKEYEEKITRIKLLKRKAPFFKTKLPASLSEKVKWKLSYYIWEIKRLFLAGNYNDISIGSSADFLHVADKLIEQEKINTVILSVGPFRYSEIIIPLKKKFPNVKFAIDFRDKREDGYSGLTARQIKFEQKQQSDLMHVVDYVLTVNDTIAKHLRSLNTKLLTYTLPHCVDDDFFDLSLKSNAKTSDKTERFIYGGELYNGMTSEIKTFVKFFEMYKTSTNKISEACFYLAYPAYQDLLNNSNVRIAPILPKREFQKELVESDFILLFRPEWSSEAFSSKFFEILCLHKPILFFGKKGSVSEFLINNKLGYHIDNDNMAEVLNSILENNKSKKIPDLNFDLSCYTFEYHSKNLISYIKESIAH